MLCSRPEGLLGDMCYHTRRGLGTAHRVRNLTGHETKKHLADLALRFLTVAVAAKACNSKNGATDKWKRLAATCHNQGFHVSTRRLQRKASSNRPLGSKYLEYRGMWSHILNLYRLKGQYTIICGYLEPWKSLHSSLWTHQEKLCVEIHGKESRLQRCLSCFSSETIPSTTVHRNPPAVHNRNLAMDPHHPTQ